MNVRILFAASATALLFAIAQPASAQIKASELGSVSQTIDGTTISMEYSRPTARGRTLFGGIVPWDIVWTPGANWATKLELNKDVEINGVDVAAGTYSVWMTPHQRDWTLTLNANPELFHFQKPPEEQGTYNISVTPEEAGHMEMLTWYFPSVSGTVGVLAMHWGETRVPMQITVPPTAAVTLDADERAQFLGEYSVAFAPIPGWEPTGMLRVTEAPNGMLRGWMPFGVHPEDELEFDLVPAGLNRFNAGLYRDGKLFNIEGSFAFEFAVMDRAESVVLRGIEGSEFGTGSRVSGR